MRAWARRRVGEEVVVGRLGISDEQVPDPFQWLDIPRSRLDGVDGELKVEDGLGSEARHGRRAHVLQAHGDLRKCLLDATKLRAGQSRPGGVVVNDANGRVQAIIQRAMPVQPLVRRTRTCLLRAHRADGTQCGRTEWRSPAQSPCDDRGFPAIIRDMVNPLSGAVPVADSAVSKSRPQHGAGRACGQYVQGPMSYQHAQYYDAIYESLKDYRQEADEVRQLLAQYTQREIHELLDVACGTGLHAQYLSEHFHVEGLDLSAEQLEVAKRRLPDTVFYLADMTAFDTGKTYDAVTCLFSAIGHLPNADALHRAVACMAHHLRPGGVLLVQPWLHPDDFVPGLIGHDFVETPDFKLTRISRSWVEDRSTKAELHHLVGRPDGIEHFVEEHAISMFTIREYLDALEAAGLDAWHVPKDIKALPDDPLRHRSHLLGRGMFVARRPAAD